MNAHRGRLRLRKQISVQQPHQAKGPQSPTSHDPSRSLRDSTLEEGTLAGKYTRTCMIKETARQSEAASRKDMTAATISNAYYCSQLAFSPGHCILVLEAMPESAIASLAPQPQPKMNPWYTGRLLRNKNVTNQLINIWYCKATKNTTTNIQHMRKHRCYKHHSFPQIMLLAKLFYAMLFCKCVSAP